MLVNALLHVYLRTWVEDFVDEDTGEVVIHRKKRNRTWNVILSSMKTTLL